MHGVKWRAKCCIAAKDFRQPATTHLDGSNGCVHAVMIPGVGGGAQAMKLRHDAQLQPGTFQQLWGRLQGVHSFQIPLSAAASTAIQTRQAVRMPASPILSHSWTTKLWYMLRLPVSVDTACNKTATSEYQSKGFVSVYLGQFDSCCVSCIFQVEIRACKFQATPEIGHFTAGILSSSGHSRHRSHGFWRQSGQVLLPRSACR